MNDLSVSIFLIIKRTVRQSGWFFLFGGLRGMSFICGMETENIGGINILTKSSYYIWRTDLFGILLNEKDLI
jgi:hypothetical protein